MSGTCKYEQGFKSSVWKTDARGWNIAHFAGKVRNKDEFNYLINEEFEDLRTSLCCKGRKFEGFQNKRRGL